MDILMKSIGIVLGILYGFLITLWGIIIGLVFFIPSIIEGFFFAENNTILNLKRNALIIPYRIIGIKTWDEFVDFVSH